MHKDCLLAQRDAIRPQDIRDIPLILPQRLGLLRELSVWAGIETEKLHTIATFDIFFSSPTLLIRNGLGYAFGLNTLMDISESSTLCFRPLDPPMENRYGLVWKRYPAFTKAAEKFIGEVKRLQASSVSP